MMSQMIVYYVTLGIIWRFLALKRDYRESLVYGIIRAKWPNNAVYGRLESVPSGV